MEAIIFEAEPREITGKSVKTLRRDGLVPAVIYGQERNLNITVNEHEFKKQYRNLTKSTVINLKLKKENIEVLIKECDYNNMKDSFVHIDFFELKKGKTITSMVPLELTGNAAGFREGGILEKHQIEIEVECLPKNIVHHFNVPIDNMNIGDTLYVKDVELDKKKYKLITSPDMVVCHIAGKTGETEEGQEVESEEIEIKEEE